VPQGDGTAASLAIDKWVEEVRGSAGILRVYTYLSSALLRRRTTVRAYVRIFVRIASPVNIFDRHRINLHALVRFI
jgi:hypothetical protein